MDSFWRILVNSYMDYSFGEINSLANEEQSFNLTLPGQEMR